jgi:hypothetical protein
MLSSPRFAATVTWSLPVTGRQGLAQACACDRLPQIVERKRLVRCPVQRRPGWPLNLSADEGHHLRSVPLCWTEQATDLVAVAVDQERGGDPERVQLARRIARPVDIDGQLPEPKLAIELADHPQSLAVDRQRHDLEVRAAELGLEPVERRHLTPAGRAPGRPDVEQHDLAPELRKAHGFALAVLELDLRQRPGAFMHGEARQRLCRPCWLDRHSKRQQRYRHRWHQLR